MRPEIIIPHEITFEKLGLEDELSMGMKPGTPVRIIREPYFGAIGNVFSLPVDLQKVETESSVRVVEVEIEDGQRVMVPRANVEIIEE
jgi:Fe2+ transport system protein FeoA